MTYGRRLLWHGLASIAILLIAIFAQSHFLVPIAGAMLPMILYHWTFLRPIAASSGLSQQAIDSVYYYGFIITLAALGGTAISMAQGAGSIRVTDVAAQFGTGLIATAYAVCARVHLTAVSASATGASHEQTMLEIVQRSRELASSVEIAIGRFVQLADEANRSVEDSRKRAVESIEFHVRDFGEAAKGVAEEARASLQEVRDLAKDAEFTKERRAFARALARSTAELGKLTEAITTAFDAMVGFRLEMKPLSADLVAVQRQQALIADRLVAMTGDNGGFDRAVQGFSAASERAVAVANDLQTAGKALSELIDALSVNSTKTKELQGITRQTAATITNLSVAIHKLDGAIEQLNGLSGGARSLVSACREIDAAAESLKITLDSLNRQWAERYSGSRPVRTGQQGSAPSPDVFVSDRSVLGGAGLEPVRLAPMEAIHAPSPVGWASFDGRETATRVDADVANQPSASSSSEERPSSPKGSMESEDASI